MMTFFKISPGLSAAVARTSRLANAVQRAASAIRLFDISASLVSSTIHRTYGHFDPQAGRIAPSGSATNAPHRSPARAGSPASSAARKTATAGNRKTSREHPVHLLPTPSLRDAKAQPLISPRRHAQTKPALAVPVFTHAPLDRAHSIGILAGLARRHSYISGTTGTIVAPLLTAALVGGAAYTFIPAFTRGWRDVLSLLRSIGSARLAPLLGQFAGGAVEFAAMLRRTQDILDLFVQAISPAIARLAAAGYER